MVFLQSWEDAALVILVEDPFRKDQGAIAHEPDQPIRSSRMSSISSLPKGTDRSSVPRTSFVDVII